MRAILQPTVVAVVQCTNKDSGGKKRLVGNSTNQVQTAACLAIILRPEEAVTMVEQPRMSRAKVIVVKEVIRKIRDNIGKNSMLDACDGSGVTMRGHNAIFRTVKNCIVLVAPSVKSNILPAPHCLATLKKEMNAKLPQFIGDYYHTVKSRTIPKVRAGGKVVIVANEVILDSKNNLFVELEVVQRGDVLRNDNGRYGQFILSSICLIY